MMSRFATVSSAAIMLLAGSLMSATAMAAASDADKAAQKKAAADCRAQVKEQAHYQEMSWVKRHKLVKDCVKDALAHATAPAAPAAAPAAPGVPAAPPASTASH